MTKFEEELSVLPVSKSTNYTEYWNKAQLLTVFKDWQPQQTLPVVPECVGELFNEYRLENIQRLFEFGIDDIKSNKMIKALMWRDKHPDTFSLAFITRKYTVEKPQLFYLKNKIELEDVGSDLIGYLNLFLTNDGYLTSNINRAKKFTQEEIDSMQTGSYEKIEVTE
ncbi:DUF1642 domain-containing protein [Lactococcus cremoris]|uniref:DUF1642 domain-containing protein n=1 Tax=Lactococcus lactis subsp. cremoris TaxID=1359 RepID=UPI0007B319FC|nr:DUF1642 domain-containing protein [Lactococcus cremoris]KZK38662.1 Phage protein [Lactococcus cremoris]MCT0504024.1 DUF1642 domain-containing protein [Lactococcus cremoris]MCT0506942.1 DUF1642 domain-containing protein [Lactococcus cremoris]TRW52142.1 DUF1642 domain-containing protein [Lactococcus lactis]